MRIHPLHLASFSLFLHSSALAQIPKGEPTLISNAPDGSVILDYCASPVLSGDGRYVAFVTDSDLLAGVAVGALQIVLLDRETGAYERISRSTTGGAANDDCGNVRISADGRFVAYSSRATNLATLELGFMDDDLDIYRYDRGLQQTVRVSVSSTQAHADKDCPEFDLSDDGRFVAFSTKSTKLSPLANGFDSQIYLRDIQLATTTLISTNSSGQAANGDCSAPRVDEDGTRVVYQSSATNLGDSQAGPYVNVWLRDIDATGPRLVSKPSHPSQPANGGSFAPAISPDGRYVAFVSAATNLVSQNPAPTLTSVFFADLKKKSIKRLPIKLPGLDEQQFSDLDLSAKGKHLTFTADDASYTYRALGIHSRATKSTRMITADDDGDLVYIGFHFAPTISSNGKFAAFGSSSNVFSPDPDNATDVFLYRR